KGTSAPGGWAYSPMPWRRRAWTTGMCLVTCGGRGRTATDATSWTPSWEGGEAVTRDEWLSGTDPLEMVNAVADGLTDRKLRLFLVACCRRLQHLPAGPGLREAVEVAERFADGTCGQEEMERAARAAGEEVDTANQGQGWPGLSKAGTAVFVACLPP